ncbi:unnamed protein product [Linum tenue]|uniref:fructose-bisphosphate aldolase n=1 Tax=Linum tenue TaxID=586396 RepID=A0AAV0HAP0_9ROSI|nr:unnamed protein product [Linum tenue]
MLLTLALPKREFSLLTSPLAPGKRLSNINVENIEENRHALLNLIFTPWCPHYLSGVILFEETLEHKNSQAYKMCLA